MKLYHGGVIAVESPRIISGEQGRDFGFAFYTTDIKEQAENGSINKDEILSEIEGTLSEDEVSALKYVLYKELYK